MRNWSPRIRCTFRRESSVSELDLTIQKLTSVTPQLRWLRGDSRSTSVSKIRTPGQSFAANPPHFSRNCAGRAWQRACFTKYVSNL